MDDRRQHTLPATIIITTYNRCSDLRECLETLPHERIAELGVETIVVDDGSSDDTSEMVEAAFSEIQLLINKENRGPSYSRNRAAHQAIGKLLLFLDDDVVVAKEWLDTMLAADDGETILGGRILDYAGDREQGGPASSTFIGKRLPCRTDRATVGASCNMGIPANCFRAVGGFDEELPYYFEDSDICIRARKAGGRFKYLADAVVRHKGSECKTGDAIRMQEQNSTYAMLKAYRGHPSKLILFTVLNGAWMGFRLMVWGCKFRFTDCRLLWTGWRAAYRRFLGRS